MYIIKIGTKGSPVLIDEVDSEEYDIDTFGSEFITFTRGDGTKGRVLTSQIKELD